MAAEEEMRPARTGRKPARNGRLHPQPRVEHIAQTIVQEVDGEHGGGQEQAGEGDDPPGGGQIVAVVGHHRPPGGDQGKNAQPQEVQRGLGQDGAAHAWVAMVHWEDTMHFGIEVVPFGEYSNSGAIMELAQAAEAAGWEAIWIWDHVVFPYGVGDPWITLAAVAAVTQQIKLVTGVAPLPRYRPHLLARMLTALDHLSQGRVIFGTGAGVDFDFTPFGEPEDARTRAAMLDEGLDLLAKLLSGAETTHHGNHYTAEAVHLVPSPLQQPRIPVWIGGGSNAALRRAAQWDGWIIGVIDEQQRITNPPAQFAQQVATLRRQRVNDAPFDVAVDGVSAAGDDGSLAREYAAAGATWWFEGIFGARGSHTQMLQRIHAGPPR